MNIVSSDFQAHLSRGAVIAVAALALGTPLGASAQTTGNIEPTDKSAWTTGAGWINFRPVNGGASVFPDHLEGFVWSENAGWIRLGTYDGGASHTYLNSTASNYGVNNDGAGTLSGFAWSTTAGWIKFDPLGPEQVLIDPADGSFDGFAWSENLGWIHFKNVSPTYNVVTTGAVPVELQDFSVE